MSVQSRLHRNKNENRTFLNWQAFTSARDEVHIRFTFVTTSLMLY